MTTLQYQSPSSISSRWICERAVVFLLSATSIWCLLVDFYHWVSMRAFTLGVFVPAAVVLIVWAAIDRGGRVTRMVCVGAAAGFIAACAYDVFRLPFVFSRDLGWQALVPPLPLFKVFPIFGAMIFGNVPAETYSLSEHLVGWAYHFSNGVTFGIMYMAMIGDATRRSWWWGVVMAVAIEIALLASPYANRFGIRVSPTFVAVTLAAHVVFGAVMGIVARRISQRWPATRVE